MRNGEGGTGNPTGEREPGNEFTALNHLIIQNGQRKEMGDKRKHYAGCKRQFLQAVPPDDQYVLVRAESDWYWYQGQNMKWRLGENQISILTGYPNRCNRSLS